MPGLFLGDKAEDAKSLRHALEDAGAEAVIPSSRRRNSSFPRDMDAYRARHLVENAFADLRQCRGITTRHVFHTAIAVLLG